MYFCVVAAVWPGGRKKLIFDWKAGVQAELKEIFHTEVSLCDTGVLGVGF